MLLGGMATKFRMKKHERAAARHGYVRVSNDDEAGNNASIAARIAAIKDRAKRDDVELVEIFQELNVSGRKFRPSI